MWYRVALFCCLLSAAAAAAEPPAVVPLPVPEKPDRIDKLRLESQRRDVDRRLQNERMVVSPDAADIRRQNALRANRQRVDRVLEK